jgi:uncharacterized protein YggU (UPF0235/DUF167 family)
MYIHIKIKIRQKEEYIKEVKPDHFEVSVRADAVRNLANKRMLEIVQEYFKTNKVKIVSGHHTRTKLLSID